MNAMGFLRYNCAVRILVISSVGQNSKHRTWLPLDGQKKCFDLLLMDFSGEENDYVQDADYYFRTKGFIYPTLFEIVQKNREIFERYDGFWIPNDDIVTDHETIRDFFSICERYGFDLAQPAVGMGAEGRKAHSENDLIPDVDYGRYNRMLVVVPGSLFRRVTFVEVMMPFLSRYAFWKILHSFPESYSAWGLDLLWAKLLGYRNMAVVDHTPMQHSRPLFGGQLYMNMTDRETSAKDEMHRIMWRHRVRHIRRVFVMVPSDESKWKERWSRVCCTLKQPIWVWNDFWLHVMKNMLYWYAPKQLQDCCNYVMRACLRRRLERAQPCVK